MCASRINRESRSCLFALNTRSKFYTDAVCFLFKRNLQPNCWQAFALTGRFNCLRKFTSAHKCVGSLSPLSPVYTEYSFHRSDSHVWIWKEFLRFKLLSQFESSRPLFEFFFFCGCSANLGKQGPIVELVLWRRLCLMSVGPVRGKVHSRVSLCLLNFERRCCFSSFVGRFQQDSSENSFLQLGRFISICADFVPEVILCFKSSWENEKNTAGIWNGAKF